jgi:transcriptional regulator with XRE-family HTH domain
MEAVKSHMIKSPSPVDRHVGSRVRLRRTLLGMSQERLGEILGVTFQQIQKYEKGINRIGAGRLQAIGSALGVPITFFYEGLPGDRPGGPENFSTAVMETPEGIRLVRAFAAIEDDQVRRKVIELVEAFVTSRREKAAPTAING